MELCEFCAVHHACYTPKHHRESNGKATSGKKLKKQKKKIEFSDEFLTRCQVGVYNVVIFQQVQYFAMVYKNLTNMLHFMDFMPLHTLTFQAMQSLAPSDI